MAERKKTNESSNKIDLLYKWISYDLQRMRNELMNEMKYSSLQVGSLYGQLKGDRENEVNEITQELRYTYKQNQSIYDGLSSLITDDVGTKVTALDEKFASLDEKFAALDKLQELLGDIEELKYNYQQLQASYESVAGVLNGEVAPKVDEIAEKLETLDQLENAINENNRQVLDAFAAIPVAEPVDYERIVDEVGDRMLELLNQIKGEEKPVAVAAAVPAPAVEIDYDRIIDGTVEKVVESMPYIPQIDMDALAVAVAAKIAAPVIDYDHLADLVVAKLAANSQQSYDVVLDETGIDAIAEKVAEKLGNNAIDYDKVCLAAQAAQILPDPVDYDRIGEILEDKLANSPMDLVLDEEGINAIARGVADQLTIEEITVEETVEEVAEAPVAEEIVEEVIEEVIEEVVEEAAEEIVEEPVYEVATAQEVELPIEETPANEELAVAVDYQEDEIGQLVDAETGLVIRLKKSFTAKMKQSEEKIKGYYSDLKNELTAYKRINSNVSWHGDRFNFGRDTVAKMTIVGKTLNLYLALDPNDPEFKSTVYHQKDVGNQKAYESTPFMVKIKSDAALKKALRLVGALAEKLATEKDAAYEAVDYVAEFAYQTTKQLFEEGFIKATKEKKVDLNF